MEKNIKEEDQLSLGTISLWDGFSYDIQIWSKRLLYQDVQIMLKGGKKWVANTYLQ